MKEVGIRFESCRRIDSRAMGKAQGRGGSGWGGGGVVVAYSASHLKCRSQKERESPQVLCVGETAQAKPRICRDDSEFQGTRADE